MQSDTNKKPIRKRQTTVSVYPGVKMLLKEYIRQSQDAELGYTSRHIVSRLIEFAITHDALNLNK